MMRKPKSAPPRMNSKYISSKTNARKEIEAWVKKDADPLTGNFEASRMSGQLTDNVTEERMLKSKLWELSKERYKFLSQNSYDKKVFIDRMMRKSSAMRRVMSARQNGETPGQDSTKSRTNNARYALLERMDPTNNRKKPPVPPGDDNEKKCVKFTESTLKGASASLSSDSSSDSEPDSESESTPVIRSNLRPIDMLPKAMGSVVREVIEQKIIEEKKPWLARDNRSGIRRKVTPLDFNKDPRYADLHHKLCPVSKKSPSVDIRTVVNKIESLHVQPKMPKDGKPKVQMKAFMRQKGYAFLN
ncbi:uncharacterized protein LOC126811708 [Patella vulgata]|uniref:uncharacterized protein LOC126811708 n=1 Tax=Patella vulgata TaxID=6465 RepID=UPI00217F9345|nr:uncharacterized protein LOC126811708 [Patella vulgata]